MVLYLGRVVELASSNKLYTDPQHPYTRACFPPFFLPIRAPNAPKNASF
jgi:ABC-type oligopeptide transport system ATPase subunit